MVVYFKSNRSEVIQTGSTFNFFHRKNKIPKKCYRFFYSPIWAFREISQTVGENERKKQVLLQDHKYPYIKTRLWQYTCFRSLCLIYRFILYDNLSNGYHYFL